MDHFYHITSKEKLGQIRDLRFLLPKTPLSGIGLVGLLRMLPFKTRYSLGIDSLEGAWLTEDMLPTLYKWTKGEIGLRVPIGKREGVIIREHKFLSTQWQLKQGYPLLDGKVAERMQRHYMDSGVPLEMYDGIFLMPEIWYPHPVGVEEIEIVKIPTFEEALSHRNTNLFRRAVGLDDKS